MIKTNKKTPFGYRNNLIRSDILIFFFCFFIGVIFGTACIKFNGTEEFLIKNLLATKTWFECFLGNSIFLILVFFLAFTAFGRAAIPFIFIFNGYCLSKSASYAIASSGINTYISFVVHYGINVAILLPFLLVLSKTAIDVSAMIFNFLFSKNKAIKAGQFKPTEFIIMFCIFIVSFLMLSFLEAGIASILVKVF